MPAPRKRNVSGSTLWAADRPTPVHISVPDWTKDARCTEVDFEIFHPEKGGSNTAAKKVCFSCEARTSCLEWALDTNEHFGILGGKTERERRKIKRDRAAAAKQAAVLGATA
jgi:hypothetical protein